MQPDLSKYEAEMAQAEEREHWRAINALADKTDEAEFAENDPLVRRLRGRADFLRNRGEVKTPELLEAAANELDSVQAPSEAQAPAVAPTQETPQAEHGAALSNEQIIRAAVSAMPHTNPLVADDLLAGYTMHTEAEDIIAIWRAASRTSTATSEQREGLAANIMRFVGLTKHQARALIAFSLDGTQPEPGLFDVLPGAATEVADPWQPIETAPRDGTSVLLFEKYEDVPFVGYWWGNREWRADQSFYDTDGDACVIDKVAQQFVTHWMPLPAAPAAKQEVDHD